MQSHKPLGYKIILLLVLLTSLPIFTIDIYLPSIDSIGKFFNADINTVQLTLTVYFILFGCVQLFYGSLSDILGRKTVILTSLGLYTIATIICVSSKSIEMLMVGKSLQSLVAGSSVIVFAIIRDVYEGHRATRILSYIGAISEISSVIAPIIGGLLQEYYSWKAGFIFLILCGALLFIAIFFMLPETKTHVQSLCIKRLIDNYIKLFLNKYYIANALCISFTFGALFTYISGAPHLFLHLLNYSPDKFGLIFSISAIGYIVGSLINPKLISLFGLSSILRLGMYTVIGGGITMLISSIDSYFSVTGIIVSQLICEIGISIIIPICTTKALQHVPEFAGQASAFIGFMRCVCAGLASMIVSQLPDQIFMPIIILIFAILALLSIMILKFFAKTEHKKVKSLL